MVRRFRRRWSWKGSIAALFLAGVLIRALVAVMNTDASKPIQGRCAVVEVVDGQTLIVRPTDDQAATPTTVRLIGIEVPQQFAAEAERWTRERTRSGVYLSLDKRRIDAQSRRLAYVYVQSQLLNAELVRRGLAQVTPYPGDSASVERELFRAQDAAVGEKIGIWKSGQRPKSRAATAIVQDDFSSSPFAE